MHVEHWKLNIKDKNHATCPNCKVKNDHPLQRKKKARSKIYIAIVEFKYYVGSTGNDFKKIIRLKISSKT